MQLDRTAAIYAPRDPNGAVRYIAAVVSNALVFYGLLAFNFIEGAKEHVVVLSAVVLGTAILTPAVNFIGNLWRARPLITEQALREVRDVSAMQIENLTTENVALRNAYSRDAWNAEERAFSSLVGNFWDLSRGRWRDFNGGQETSDLREIVGAARWPVGNAYGGDGQLRDFVRYIYPENIARPAQELAVFPGIRTRIVRQIEKWGTRVGPVPDPESVLLAYLTEMIVPTHGPTLMLVMYLEIALAARIGQAPADLSRLHHAREALWPGDHAVSES